MTPAEPAVLPAAPPAALELFGPVIGRAEQYGRLLAGAGVERGLIGPREVPRLWERHLINSAAVASLVPSPGSLVDLGSGAGLPGIVLALLLPDVQVTLLEPMLRRSVFLAECLSQLELRNAQVCRARAEDMAGKITADAVTARAVAPLARLAELAAGLLRPGGLVLAIKGAQAEAEVTAARKTLRRLGIRDAEVLHLGSGKVDPAATIVRFTASRHTGGERGTR